MAAIGRPMHTIRITVPMMDCSRSGRWPTPLVASP
jgi:hypothetical protein